MYLAGLLNQTARNFKDRLAVVQNDRRETYRQLHYRALKFLGGLFAAGIEPTDRVAILNYNSLEYVETDLALLLGGLVRVSLNNRLAAREIEEILIDSNVRVLVFDDGFLNLIEAMRDRLSIEIYIRTGSRSSGPDWCICYEDLILRSTPIANLPRIGSTDLAMLFYTSGTTGRPKGVLLSHRALMGVIFRELADTYPITKNDRLLICTQLSHGAYFRILAFLCRGASVYLHRSFDPEAFVTTIESQAITVSSLVPTTLNILLALPKLNSQKLSSLKILTYGGSAMPIEKLKEALDLLGPILYQSYGQAEAPVTITHLPREEHIYENEFDERLSSAGYPHTGVLVRTVDEEGVDVITGEPGEILVRSDHVMDGYWNLPEETAQTLKNGWLHTGDIGRMDDRGFLYILDRKKNMIISGGLNVYCREVEDVLYEAPSIHEAFVFGLPDDKWGETVNAAVVLEPNSELDIEELKTFCRTRIARYKVPKNVFFVDQIPKNTYGKIDKRLVIERCVSSKLKMSYSNKESDS